MALTNNMFKLVTVYINQVQEIEYVLGDLRLKRDINAGVGAQLDGLGRILDEARGTLNDVEYRLKLLLKIMINTSSGIPETAIAVIKDLTNSNSVVYTERYPASVSITVDGDETINEFKTIIQRLKAVLPAGVDVEIVYINPALDAFVTGDDGAFPSTGEGFLEKDYSETTFGYSAGALAEKA